MQLCPTHLPKTIPTNAQSPGNQQSRNMHCGVSRTSVTRFNLHISSCDVRRHDQGKVASDASAKLPNHADNIIPLESCSEIQQIHAFRSPCRCGIPNGVPTCSSSPRRFHGGNNLCRHPASGTASSHQGGSPFTRHSTPCQGQSKQGPRLGGYNGTASRCVLLFSINIGSEADIVVCVFSHTHLPSLRRDLDFLYNRPRLNVAISRAKTISIVISSQGVLNPPVEALVSKENLEGFSYLKAFEERAWAFQILVEETRSEQSPEYILRCPRLYRPQFSSQDYDDKSWEEAVKETLGESQKSQGSSQYDDLELIALMQTMQT